MMTIDANLLVTIGLIRLIVLVAWLFYAMFEKDIKRLLFALVIMLMLPNIITLYFGLIGP